MVSFFDVSLFRREEPADTTVLDTEMENNINDHENSITTLIMFETFVKY